MQDESDDKTLMLRFQDAGDAAAFETLFRRHEHPFFRFLVRLSGDAAIAQDVCQQAWLQLIETARHGGFRPDASASFRTYLYTLGRNRYVDAHVRAHAASRTDPLEAHEGALDALAAEYGDETLAALEGAQDRERIARALAALPAPQREVLAFWLDGYDLREIARMTDTSRHTLVARKKAALAKLAKELAS